MGPCSSLCTSADLAATEWSLRLPVPHPLLMGVRVYADAEADMLLAEASSAICVQRFDDSRNSAIHTTYRISLRSSSLREPRYPLLRVVLWVTQPAMPVASLQMYKVGCLVGKGASRPCMWSHSSPPGRESEHSLRWSTRKAKRSSGDKHPKLTWP